MISWICSKRALMDKVRKFVDKLQKREAQRVLDAIGCIRAGEIDALDVKKLKGGDTRYCVRIGKVRILFTKVDEQNIITDVDFRNETTY